MYHLAAKNNFVDPGGENAGPKKGNNDPYPLCPKPRRAASTLPWQLLGHSNSMVCNNHHQMNFDGRNGVLNKIDDDKTMDGDADELCRCSNCLSTSYDQWCGSPPRRTNNPLVHDVQFRRIDGRMDAFPPHTPI